MQHKEDEAIIFKYKNHKMLYSKNFDCIYLVSDILIILKYILHSKKVDFIENKKLKNHLLNDGG